MSSLKSPAQRSLPNAGLEQSDLNPRVIYSFWTDGQEPMPSSELNAKELAQRGESLIRHSSNRYLTTVRIAFRAKQRRFDDFDGLLDDSMIKPVQRAIVELSDEQDQPDLLPG
jgi:DNA-directed RNA polymerase subunit omega